MDKNQEIFEKARYLGLNLDGETEEEQLKNIAHQVGISNYNPHLEQNSLSKKLDDLYENRFNDYFNHNLYANPIITNENEPDKSKSSSINRINTYRNRPWQTKNDEVSQRLQEGQRKNKFSSQYINVHNYLRAQQNQNSKENGQKATFRNGVTKKGLKALGVPAFFANMSNKKTSEIESEKENIAFAQLGIKLPIIGLGFFVVVTMFIILVTIGGTVTEDDESEANNNKNVQEYITGSGTTEQLTDELVYLNICRVNSDKDLEVEECLNSPAGKYFTHLKELYAIYNQYSDRNGNPLELNIGLILETISYGITDKDLFTEENLDSILDKSDELAEAQVEEYQEVGDLYTLSSKSCITKSDQIVKGIDGETSYYRISNDKFISYLLYGKVHENYQGNIKKYDVDIHPESNDECIPDGRNYNAIIEDNTTTTYSGDEEKGYIYLNFLYELNMTDDEIEINSKEVLEEIYKRAKENYNAGTASSNFICSGVMVTGDSAGVYSLEDYIAGVVQRENNWYQGDNIENMKAQAIAARTYVLRVTTNCTLPIENTATKQTFNPNPSDEAKRAALETANQILVNDNGDYISTEYDAFAVKEITEEFYILKQANLQIPIEWVTSNISSANLEYYETHSHGRGMSQWGSRYLQTQGYSYDQILSTFYPTGKLTTIGNSITGNIPSNVNDLKNRYYFNFDINIYQGNTLFGQCVWYAKHRAMEILSASSLDEGTKKLLINSIYATGGNGQDWFKNPSNTYFKKSTNINEPKAGAIVSWTRGQYGHVAIIERVYTGENGVTMVTLTEGWRTKNSSGSGWYVTNDLWSVVNFRKKELTLSQLQTYSGIFNGYVYLY